MSIRVDGTFFDGARSAGTPAQLTVMAEGTARLFANGQQRSYDFASIQVSSRLGNSARYLTFPDGTKLQTLDNEAVDACVASQCGSSRVNVLHALERNWGWVALAAAFTGILLWWSIYLGLPWLANRVAHAIPIAIEATMGEQTIKSMDAHLLSPSRLQDAQQRAVHELFARLSDTAKLEVPLRLELRHSDVFGANAFALPSGIIVVTDEMVELADGQYELLAVLAHEAGHVHHRHVMRSILQNSAVALALAVTLGDITSVAGLAASIPTLLVESGFSRRFEFEADAFAAAYLDQSGISRAHLASILNKLMNSQGMGAGQVTDYLSTHPSVSRRIEAISD